MLWTSGFVLLTLLINAPLLPIVLRLTGLATLGHHKVKMRGKAVRALERKTAEAIQILKDDEDEMLRGTLDLT